MLSYIYIQYTRTQKAKNIVDNGISDNFESFKATKKEDLFNYLMNENKSRSLGATEDNINNMIESLTVKLNDPFHYIFKTAIKHYNKNQHLKGVVLFNTSKAPFITSDNPVLNIVTLFDKRISSFFMPVSPAHCLFFFDENYFRVKNIENIVFISDINEIHYINTLQSENCNNNIYLPHLHSYCTLRDVLHGNSDGGAFWNHIKAISLSKFYANNITIHLTGGHAVPVEHY
nr:DUF4238 domain-containing protein [Pectobacterium aquaticum]RRO00001.1 DUF4238 domain-containing protein [Pectobacterium aquaticum]